MTYLPLTRYAALAASARAQVRPHRIAAPPVQVAELAHRLVHTPVDTPSGFAEDVLGMTLTSEQRAVLDVVVGEDVRQVAARVPRSDNYMLAAVLTAWAALVSCAQPWGDVPRTGVVLAPFRMHAEDVWRCLAAIVESAVLPGKVLIHRRLWLTDDTEGPERVLGYSVWNVEPPALAGLAAWMAVVVDADAIADPGMRATLNRLGQQTYGASRFVALGDTDAEPGEWFAVFEAADDVTVPVTSTDHDRT